MIILILCMVLIILFRFASVDTKSFFSSCEFDGPPTDSIPLFLGGENTRSKYKVAPFEVNPMHQAEYDRIDNETSEQKCARYGFKPSNKADRRIFFGAMLANENWDVLQMHAAESYGIYHVAAFVESNTTHMATPRKLRYYDSEERVKLEKSGIWGLETKVHVGFWLLDWPDLLGMDRESEQRNHILKLWKEAGMTPEDVGIMSDADEVVSRDFLRALQRCDIPELEPGQSCERPKIVTASVSFESSPYCFRKDPWFHPDIISGECIEGIGDPSERIVPVRMYQRQYGQRSHSYGQYNLEHYPPHVMKFMKQSHRYPLFSGTDIRTAHGDRGSLFNYLDRPGEGVTHAYGIAYHFHNWFEDLQELRNKLKTYAHGNYRIMGLRLSEAGEDLDVMVRCVRELGNKANPNPWARDYFENPKQIKGQRPIFLLDEEYCDERHRALKEMLRLDEEKYGSGYDSNGNWLIEDERSQAEKKNPKGSKTKKTKKGENKATEEKRSILSEGGNIESLNATVMGMAAGLRVDDIRRFVGSLRNVGFTGHIILGINADAPDSLRNYLNSHQVVIKPIKYTDCTFEPFYKNEQEKLEEGDQSNVRGLSICVEPYPDVKSRWVKYPMGRDWLNDCLTCSGPVFLTDVRDVYFQDDPFGPGSPEITHLQVFEEHPNQTTAHWLVDWPVGECKGVHLEKPMLCSGSTIGTREDMMAYLNIMYDEMKRWLSDPKCRFKTLADDQSIHNWLFYNNDLPNAVAIPNRDGIVNTVGFEIDKIFQKKNEHFAAQGMTENKAYSQPFEGSSEKTWISSSIYGLTDEEGYFTDNDGSRSRVIHQWDRGAWPLIQWMDKQTFLKDRES